MIYPGQVIDTRYQIIREIGEGGAGVIYLAYHLKLEKYVVIKKLKSGINTSINVRQEVDILKNLHHKYLPQVYDYLEMEGEVYTVIDYIEGKDLSEYVKAGIAVPENLIIKWLLQLTDVLEYLHNSNNCIIHGDIKPSNIMINSDGDVCLIDFNISLDRNSFTLSGITPAYASPEQIELAQKIDGLSRDNTGAIRRDGSEIELSAINEYIPMYIDKRADIYSLGACFYHLITGIRPYNGILEDNAFGGTDYYRRTLVEIIRKSMNPDREKRFQTAAEMHKAIIKSSDEYKLKFIIRCLIAVAISVLFVAFVAGAIILHNKRAEQAISEKTAVYNRMIDEFNGQNYSSSDFRLRLVEKYENDEEGKTFIEEDAVKKSEVNYMIGYTFYLDEDYDRAIEYYNKALNINGGSAELCRELSVCYARKGNFIDSEYYLNLAKEYGIKDSDAIYIKAEIEADKGDNYQAVEYLAKIPMMSNDEQLLLRAAYLLSDVSNKTGSYKELIKNYRGIELGRDSQNILDRLLMNSCYAESRGSEEDKTYYLLIAEEYGDKLREAGYINSDDRIIMANVYIDQEKYEDAFDILNSAENADSDYRILAWEAYVSKEDAMSKGKAFTQAYELAEKAKNTESYKLAVASGNVDSGAEHILEILQQ